MAADIDLFEILELSPGPPEPDEAAVAAQLAKKKQQWGRDLSQGGQKAKREAQKNLELLPLLKEIVADPLRRRKAAGVARARLEASSREARRELEGIIGLLKKGSAYCDPGQLEALVKRFGRLGRPEIESRLRAAGVSLERQRSEPAVQPIDATLAQAIDIQLKHLARKSLYDFLGLPPQSSLRSLQDKAKEIYRENQRLGRGDSASAAANRLAGLCTDRVFADETAKQRYDAHLATAAMDALRPDLDFAGLGKSLSGGEVEHFLDLARRMGVSAEAARAYIERYAEERGWRIESVKVSPERLAQLERELAEARRSPSGAAGGQPPFRRSDSFRNLQCRRNGQALLLTWDWPEGIVGARIRLDHREYPENPESPGAGFDLTAAEFRREGGFVLRQPSRQKHYFAVFARLPDGSFSAAARIFAGLGQETTVRYRLALKRSLVRRSITGAQLELRSAEDDLCLPALVVVGKPGRVPISPRDGRVLLQVAAARLEKGLASIGMPPAEWNSGCYIKVFFPEAAAGEGLRLLPAAKEELFLG